MLDGNDVQTFHSLRLLTDSISAGSRPFVIWIGAGASAWCGYPLWEELADTVHSEFLRYEANFHKKTAIKMIVSKRFPEFFQICKDLNQQRYFSILAESLKTRETTPVYDRFIDTLKLIRPLHIVTTNADELLENNITAVTTIQRTDLERCVLLLQRKESFVGKLHGSISAIQSTVFTVQEYSALLKDKKFRELIKHIFTEATVLFVGYGLADQYVLDQLSRSAELGNIFGPGPHFAVAPSNVCVPSPIKPIRYIAEPDKDHRSAIQVIDEVRVAKNLSTGRSCYASTHLKPHTIKSAHLISDIFPPGTHRSTSSATLTGGVGMIWGDGLTNAEIPSTISTAMHDLIVGLLCFDTVYAYLTLVGQIHNLIGSRAIFQLIMSESLKFVLMPTYDVILYRDSNESNGMLNSIYSPDKGGGDIFDQQIRRILKPLPEVDTEFVEAYYEVIKSATVFYTRETEPDIRSLVGGLLLRPSIRRLIGMSGGTSLMSLPAWMIYPVLRLAHVVRTGATCQLLGIASTKLEYGSAGLAGPTFATSSGQEWADGMASYALTGRFDSDLGMYNLRDANVLSSILKFRDSQSGMALRKEILDQLSLRLCSDFVASVNAGLRAAIPLVVLQAAHDQIAGLLIAEGPVHALTPAIWNNWAYAEKALSLWKMKSLSDLKNHCQKYDVGINDRCPCGSGERLRFCCAESLNWSIAADGSVRS